jgi:muconate cycloisomerase
LVAIASIETFKAKLPFRLAFAHSKATRNCSENLVVQVCLDNGICGYGESIPRDYVTGETFDGADFAVRALYAPALTGLRLVTVNSTLNVLKHKFDFFGLREASKGASWCAIELAVLDALSQCFQVPLHRLFGASRPGSVHYGAVTPICPIKSYRNILLFYRLFGFETVKIKVGGKIEEDIERVRLARRIMGNKAKLRIDANGAWANAKEAIEAMDQLRQFNVLSVEQPVGANETDAMHEITNSIPEEVIADESLCTIEQARTLAQNRICTGFNIRLSKNGGWLAAQEIASIARTYGIALYLGAQVGEGGILSSAGRAFACVEGPFDNCEGSNNFFLLKQDLVEENLNVGWGGYGKPIDRPGLGVTVHKGMLLTSTKLMADPDIISKFYDSPLQPGAYLDTSPGDT